MPSNSQRREAAALRALVRVERDPWGEAGKILGRLEVMTLRLKAGGDLGDAMRALADRGIGVAHLRESAASASAAVMELVEALERDAARPAGGER